MRLFVSIVCLFVVASFASATHPIQIRAVVVQQYAQPIYAPVVQQIQADCGYAQGFAQQQFYAAPIQFQRVQQFGYAQQFQVQRFAAPVQIQRVQQIQVQRVRAVQPVIQRQVIRTRTVIR